MESLFGSKTRVRLLSTLLLNPDGEFYIRQLSRRIKVNINAVRLELNNLEEIGLLKTTKKGKAKYYTVNKEARIYQDLRSIFLKTEGAVDYVKKGLSDFDGLELAFIFGSYTWSRRKMPKKMEIFLVGEIAEEELYDFLAQAERDLSLHIEYALITQKQLAEKVTSLDPFVTKLLKRKKIPLVGNPTKLVRSIVKHQ